MSRPLGFVAKDTKDFFCWCHRGIQWIFGNSTYNSCHREKGDMAFPANTLGNFWNAGSLGHADLQIRAFDVLNFWKIQSLQWAEKWRCPLFIRKVWLLTSLDAIVQLHCCSIQHALVGRNLSFRYYTLHYYLADDTAEILENMSRTLEADPWKVRAICQGQSTNIRASPTIRDLLAISMAFVHVNVIMEPSICSIYLVYT